MSTPGSPEAVAAGCSCPVFDNGHGRGYMGQKNVFSINVECIIHSISLAKKEKRYCHECESEIEGPMCYDCLNEHMLNGGAD
jgi:hypothetical protein